MSRIEQFAADFLVDGGEDARRFADRVLAARPHLVPDLVRSDGEPATEEMRTLIRRAFAAGVTHATARHGRRDGDS